VLGARTIDAALNNSTAHFEHSDPPDNHDYEHDKVEKSKLEDYEEHVKESN
jgi:hypothetical protein